MYEYQFQSSEKNVVNSVEQWPVVSEHVFEFIGIDKRATLECKQTVIQENQKMSLAQNTKLKASDTDSDEEADEAQMRLFLEAADHTLLTNAMYQKPTQTTNSIQAPAAVAQEKPKSERYLAEEEGAAAARDLQISKEMQTHIWGKLSTIIADQIEYCASSGSSSAHEEEMPWLNQVKLVSHADCFVVDDIEPATGPQRKPTIKRRQLANEEEEEDHRTGSAKAFASVAVSGDSILSGEETQAWAPRRVRNDKVFRYKARDKLGHQLEAIEPTNEFTQLRRSNGWNETKIGQQYGNKRAKTAAR